MLLGQVSSACSGGAEGPRITSIPPIAAKRRSRTVAARQSMTRKLGGAASAMSSWLCDKIVSGLRARSMSSGDERGGLTRRLGDQGEVLPMEKLMRPEPML